MKLIGFSYQESDWKLDFPTFELVNLLVGKNASGKSRSVAAIVKMAGFLAEKVKFNQFDNIDTTLVFQSSLGKRLTYSFTCKSGIIIKEILRCDDEPIVLRSYNIATIKGETIYPPQDKLVAHIRRDVKQYPEIEDIMLWAMNVVPMSFINLGKHYTASLELSMNNTYDLVKLVSSLSKKSLSDFYLMAANVGYKIKDVSQYENLPIVFVKEEGVKRKLLDHSLSTGMHRALTILLYLVYFRQMGCPALLVIDDLCEGLDYDRSIRLGKEVYSFCEENNIQLLATSNDAFLMDVVNINYWSVLLRDGSDVKVMSRATHTALFDDFKFTGLSNFDFFSSDYIPNYLSKHPEI